MRKLILAGTLVAGLSIASPALAKDVRIVKAGFSPTTTTITAGDTIRWVNADTLNHQVVSDTGAFVSPILAPRRTFSFRFTAAGTYRYRDALEPAERGTIVVRGAPPSVTLGVSAPIILHGSEVKLSGAISSQKAGETVTLFAQPYGQASFVQLAVLTTVTGGAWDFLTAPAILTTYQVRYKNAASQPVTVQVRPKVTLMPYGRVKGSFHARVNGSRSFAGRFILLQRRTAFGQWVTIQQLKLGPQSGRIFRVPKRLGITTYRVFLSGDQAGPGFLETWSGTQKVRRTR